MSGGTSGPRRSLLLVEDDEVDRLGFRRHLRQSGFTPDLHEAGSVAEALELVGQRRFDWIVVDYQLPDGAGVEVLTAAREVDRHVAVVVLTGQGDEDLAVELMKRGASDYIAKGSLTPGVLARSLTSSRLLADAQRDAYKAARAQRFLADSGAALMGSIEYDETLDRAVRVCVDDWSDVAVLELLREDGTVERHAYAGDDLELQARLERRDAPEPGDAAGWAGDGVPGSALVDLTATGSARNLLRSSDLASALEERGAHTALVTGLSTRGRRLGRLVQIALPGREPYDDRDRDVATDFGSRVALALDNARLYREVRDAVDVRESVLAVVAHDLRNPLNAIYATVRLLLEVDLPPEKKREQLELIRRASDGMDRLIENLVDMAKLEAGGLEISPIATAPAALVGDALESMAPQATDAGVSLEVDVSPGPPVRADHAQVVRVLWNLLGNAIKHSPPGGTVRLSTHESDGFVTFRVDDEGPGVDRSQMPHLFSWFWQADRARKGAGLGLAISKAIVEKHGGTISVESEPGRGASFRFSLPAARPGRHGAAHRALGAGANR